MNETLVLLIILFFGGIVFSFLVYFLLKISERLGQQVQVNLQQAKDIQEIKESIFSGKELQGYLKNGLAKTRDLLEELRRLEEIRHQKEVEFSERIKRIDEIIAGTSTKGMSGEEILRETFKKLPPEMIDTNFSVGGKVVEFALILPNGKRFPIDSKWPSGELLLKLEKATDPIQRKEIIVEIEKEAIKRIKEIKNYIDPNVTWPQAIAALPDSVYGVCQKAHLEAQKFNIILIPYSMVLPLILYIYRLHLQYALSIDMENLKSHLINISRNLDEMDIILENKIFRSLAMIQSAAFDYKQIIGKMKSSLNAIESKPQKALKDKREKNS